MSISGSGNEVETAAGRVDVAAGTTTENAQTFEASEDRILVGAAIKNNEADATAEVSFSSSMLTDSQTADEIASGVIVMTNSGSDVQVIFPEGTGPLWDAGEEISVHVDNAGANSVLNLTTLYYRPVGDFSRDRLRNR